MDQLTQINTIQFGIQSDKDIVNRSVCVIDKTTLTIEPGSVYDPRLGCVENNARCETCNETVWKCTGHFGHVNLNVPIILFYKQVVTMLKIFCFKCHRLLCTKEELNLQGVRGYDKIIAHLSAKISFCGHCNSPHPEIKYEPNDNVITAVYKYKTTIESSTLKPETVKMIFDNIPLQDVAILGVNPNLFHPKHLVLTKFPVIPTCCRPRMVTPDNISDDDLSISLVDIIKANNLLHKDTTNEKARAIIKFKTLTYCDNSRGKAVHNTNHKPMTGIKERITKKTGHVRQNLMGKRCDKTARTVVGPDPTLRLNEVAVPEEIANTLTIPEYVTPLSHAKLTELVNTPGKASVVIRKNGTRISVPAATTELGTCLRHGDQIVRGCETLTVTNCKMDVREGDVITRPSSDNNRDNSKRIPTKLPKKKEMKLEIGDKVERFLKDGDFVLLNRQPTLHRNSMQGMKVVVKPGKTMRVNLAIVTGFNMDFDGDEGNMFVEETMEARVELEHNSNAIYNILSAQSNKPEMVIVQDSLLGAYKMTENVQPMSKSHFMKCMMHIEHAYNYTHRLAQIRTIRNEAEDVYTTHALFGFIFPSDFHIHYNNITIKHGVVTSGFFDKSTLKGSKGSLIRVLCMEYGVEVTARFIDNIQFLTNGWLELNPFSVGIQDCLIGDPQKKEIIKNITHKYFLEASNVSKSTDHPQIREARVNCSLNKAKDIGLKIAKETLKPDNNFISTVTSGSKGDYFNIAQITGLLGQQNLNGHRPPPTLSNKKRTLIHYPETIEDPARKYRSRGFVASSFIDGMHPDEMFFHAMTGREGMTKTAMGTATSGYIQRSIVKINEDLKVEYDGTVRDAKKNIYQYAFGNHGFDPSKVNIDEDKGEVYPVNFERLADKLNRGDGPAADRTVEAKVLTEEEIEDIVDECGWRSNIPEVMSNQMRKKQEGVLRRELNKIKLVVGKYNEFKNYIVAKYHSSRATPGECVGIIGAQSIGERQTQTTLNTFHTAGKLQQSGVGRLEEILNMSKKIKVKTCTVYFKDRYKTSDALRKDVGCSLVGLHFGDLYKNKPVITMDGTSVVFEFSIDPKVMFTHRLNTYKIANAIRDHRDEEVFRKCRCMIGPTSITLTFNAAQKGFAEYITALNKILVCGMEGVRAMHLDYEGGEWFAVTEGTNLRKMLAHPLIDNKRLYCNDFWEVYECLGISMVRQMLFDDLKKVVGGVNTLHIQLLVDKMTYRGKPCSITRYTMRNNDVGPLSKATFEESTDILLAASMRTEIENNAGVSAAIISGNQPKAGTGFMSLLVDYEKIIDEGVEGYDEQDQKENEVLGQVIQNIQDCDEYIPDDF